jgi:hypothetical protein
MSLVTWIANASDSLEAMEAPMCVCGAQGPMYPTRDNAVAAWNTRALSSTEMAEASVGDGGRFHRSGHQALEGVEAREIAELEIRYHSAQLATYLAQPTINERDLARARWHNNKIIQEAAALSSTPTDTGRVEEDEQIGLREAAQDLLDIYDKDARLVPYRKDRWECLREVLAASLDTGREAVLEEADIDRWAAICDTLAVEAGLPAITKEPQPRQEKSPATDADAPVKLGNPLCPLCLAAHPESWDCQSHWEETSAALVPNTGREAVLEEIADERCRQVEVEGWTPEHDDTHGDGALRLAAACYAAPEAVNFDHNPNLKRGVPAHLSLLFWPWDFDWWKPRDTRRDLIRAAAMLVAEIERLDRATLTTKEPRT